MFKCILATLYSGWFPEPTELSLAEREEKYEQHLQAIRRPAGGVQHIGRRVLSRHPNPQHPHHAHAPHTGGTRTSLHMMGDEDDDEELLGASYVDVSLPSTQFTPSAHGSCTPLSTDGRYRQRLGITQTVAAAARHSLFWKRISFIIPTFFNLLTSIGHEPAKLERVRVLLRRGHFQVLSVAFPARPRREGWRAVFGEGLLHGVFDCHPVA